MERRGAGMIRRSCEFDLDTYDADNTGHDSDVGACFLKDARLFDVKFEKGGDIVAQRSPELGGIGAHALHRRCQCLASQICAVQLGLVEEAGHCSTPDA